MLRKLERLSFSVGLLIVREFHKSSSAPSNVVEDQAKSVHLVEAAEIVSETVRIPNEIASLKSSTVDADDVKVMNKKDNEYIELHKLHYMYSQDGPFIGSRTKDKKVDQVSLRKRRHVVRVPQPEMEYRPNETSFRRLPKNYILPNEFELRALYPMSTSLPLIEGRADCVDHDAFDVDGDPAPMAYSMIAPPDWKPDAEYPYMVVLPDHRGIPRDFEDVCANFFERPVHQEHMMDQRWVIISPVVNLRHNMQIPVEGVVARFCDWVTDNFCVEHGKVHLFGKGNGAYVALRTVLENKDLVLSVTAILGRSGSPFRPLDRAQDKVKNFNGVHSLVYVPGLLRKQDWYYKFKFMLDMARVRPPIRNVHFADVRDHQVYYAINPQEFWNYMKYFRQYNMKMITESGYAL
jgi:pimeloyl-ACP methyl ester carboxylesterase